MIAEYTAINKKYKTLRRRTYDRTHQTAYVIPSRQCKDKEKYIYEIMMLITSRSTPIAHLCFPD
jgi:hypothetical protein